MLWPLYACVLFILNACASPEAPNTTLTTYEIGGRDEIRSKGIPVRYPVYRVKAPLYWEIERPSSGESIADSTKPLVEFAIEEDGEAVRIAIHNFPSEIIDQRIPPSAQIARWKRQFDAIDPASVHTEPQAFGGFTGLFFQASGTFHGQETAMLCWAMQLPAVQYRNLLLPGTPEELRFFKQMRADYTIKVTGPVYLVEKHKEAIIAFARSFELIQEIPLK